VGVIAGVRAVMQAIEGPVQRPESLGTRQQQHAGRKGPEAMGTRAHETSKVALHRPPSIGSAGISVHLDRRGPLPPQVLHHNIGTSEAFVASIHARPAPWDALEVSMLFRMIYDESLAQAAYLIGCQRTGEAIVVDPERDVDRYERLAASEGLRITSVAETHIHADFVSGARELAERGAKVFVSDEGDADWKYQWLDKRSTGGAYDHQLLKDGDTFMVGHVEFRAVHTPGHTPEHICFMVTDRGGGADEPMGVITGDFLFVGDLGRPDLLESAAGMAGAADSSAHRLWHSVKRLMSWPEFMQVWPAHGAGSACGKALGAVPQTTVGYERRFNPALHAARSEQGFVDFILADQPEPPLYFAHMKRDNKMGPRVLGGVPVPREMTPEAFARLDGRVTAIVDTRSWKLFRRGHVAGSLSLPLGRSFSQDAGSMVSDGETIHLVVEPSRLDETVRELIRVGLDRFGGWIAPDRLEAVAGAGAVMATVPQVGVEEARVMLETQRPLVLDVRRATEFAAAHIAGATNIAHTRLLARIQELPADRPILVHCQLGGRSAKAASLLQRHGRTVTDLAGGFAAWRAAREPITVP
jgi:hydroxyacylglutathione hydrolase